MVEKTEIPVEEGTLPKHYGKIHNLADNKDVCDELRSWTAKNITRFTGQSPREKYVKDGGIADTNDKMYRVSLTRDTTNSQTKETYSNVTSPIFRVAVRTITAAINSIMFQDDLLPAEFEPEINTSEYTEDDGKWIAEQQNALEQLIFDEDKRAPKIKELIEYVNKDSIRVAIIEWKKEIDEVTENVPNVKKGKNENGTWREVNTKTTKRTVVDWPVLTTTEVENCYFDSYIPEIEDQRCFAIKSKVGREALVSMQNSGFIQNVEKITDSNMWDGETTTGEDNPAERRGENAGEDGDLEPTGEIELWRTWGWVPISERETPKTGKRKASWDKNKNEPILYEAMWAGSIHSEDAVCLKLVKLPHRHKKIPAKFIRSHNDNKGAFSTGYGQQMKSLYWQAVTNLNQAIDNITERTWSPMVLKGQLFSRKISFYRKSALIKLSTNATLDNLKIPDTTQITMEMYRIIEGMTDDLFGINKSRRGEFAGARATATENINVTGFAEQPLDEQALYIMDQLYPWMYELDSSYMRQYADPETVLRVTHAGKNYEIYPTHLHGPIKTKVTAMARFKRSNIEKQGFATFLQNAMPLFADVMPKSGKRVLGREALRMFNVPKINEIFPFTEDREAWAVAKANIDSMLLQERWVEPIDGENHATQIGVMQAALREYGALPEGDRPSKDGFALLKANIEQRRNMMAEEAAQAQQAQTTQAGPPPDEGAEGQLAGDVLGGAQGGQI